MPQLDQLPFVFGSQLFWLALVFGIIFFVIGRGMLPKIRSTVAAREKMIADDLKKAEAARIAAEEAEVRWRVRMDDARRDAARRAQNAREDSAREAEARIKKTLDEIDANVERARMRIWTSVQAARGEIETMLAESAQQIVEQLTGLKVDRNVAARAVAAELELDAAARARQGPAGEQKKKRAA